MVQLPLPVLVIVLGPPASGKTTLAQRLAAHLSLPLMTKDMIKELLCDALGCDDVERSRRLGYASIMLLLQFVEVQVAARRSCVVECNFRATWNTPRFLELQERHPYEPVQVLCRAGHEVLFERYRQRAESGERHPGHHDRVRLDEFSEEIVRELCVPLAIGGQVIEVDTTRFEAVDYAGVFARVAAIAGQR